MRELFREKEKKVEKKVEEKFTFAICFSDSGQETLIKSSRAISGEQKFGRVKKKALHRFLRNTVSNDNKITKFSREIPFKQIINKKKVEKKRKSIKKEKQKFTRNTFSLKRREKRDKEENSPQKQNLLRVHQSGMNKYHFLNLLSRAESHPKMKRK